MTDEARKALSAIAEIANYGAKKLGEIDPSNVTPKIAGSNNCAIERFWLIARTAKAALTPSHEAGDIDALTGTADDQGLFAHEAGTQDDEYNPAYDDGITFAILQLAELTGSKDWQMRDGSEDHDTDVRDTIMDVLKCAGLYDDETGTFAVWLCKPPKAGTQEDSEDRMEKISALIARLQKTKDQWGDTCVYIRRGGLSWGAVALNRQSDDKKFGTFDLQAQHDRDMLERLGQIDRLKASRDRAEKKLAELEAAGTQEPVADIVARIKEACAQVADRAAAKSKLDGSSFAHLTANAAAKIAASIRELIPVAAPQPASGARTSPVQPFNLNDPRPIWEQGLSKPAQAKPDCGAWHMVDTAPHETYVLLGWWDEGKWNCQTGMASHGWRRGAYSTMSCHGQATHWMPLPKGPEVSSTDQYSPEFVEEILQADAAPPEAWIKAKAEIDDNWPDSAAVPSTQEETP